MPVHCSSSRSKVAVSCESVMSTIASCGCVGGAAGVYRRAHSEDASSKSSSGTPRSSQSRVIPAQSQHFWKPPWDRSCSSATVATRIGSGIFFYRATCIRSYSYNGAIVWFQFGTLETAQLAQHLLLPFFLVGQRGRRTASGKVEASAGCTSLPRP